MRNPKLLPPLMRLAKFGKVLLCMIANPPTSQIWGKKKKKEKSKP
jgi:hypothetical protein